MGGLSMAWESLTDELGWDDVGGRLLANIAKGMYSPHGVLREYVQNAADAYRDLGTASDEHKIIITPSKDALSIQDFGVGMDDKGIREAKKIAVSTKAAFDDRVGFRGIGIWAGLPACRRLVVDSTKAGHAGRYRLIFEFEEIMKHLDDNINIRDLVNPHYRIERHAADKREHYTRVTLEGITDGYKQLLDVQELKRVASQVLPSAIDPGFQHHTDLKKLLERWPAYSECHIIIQTPNGLEEAFRRFPEDDLEAPEEKVLVSDEGVELARGWYCRTKRASLQNFSPLAVRGFQLRVKNFAVGDVNMFSSEQGYSYNIHNYLELKTTSRLPWFCGEIHVTNNDIKPDTRRDDLEREPAARLFIEKLRGFYRDRILEAGAYSDFNPYRKALDDAEEIIARSKKKESNRKPATPQQVQQIITKLSEVPARAKDVSGDQSKKLFKQLLCKQSFRDRCAKALTHLIKLIPAAAAGGDNRQNTGEKCGADNARGGGFQVNKKPKGSKGASKNGDDGSVQRPTNEDIQSDVEELVSEIFEVLERSLGDDFDGLPKIEEEIQQIVDAWAAAHAS